MALFYLDTSALVKRYRSEQGSDFLAELLDNPPANDRFYLSFLSVLELTSGLLRLAKAGQISDELAREALSTYRSDLRELLRLWPLGENIFVSAIDVVEQHRIRSADAIHLATVLAVSQAEPETELVLVSSDRELVQATQDAGLTVVNPEDAGAGKSLARLREM